MSTSYAATATASFTVTHARHMAAKIATDLKRMQRFYGAQSDNEIAAYEEELIELIRGGFLSTVTYGFRKDDVWIEPTLRYTARDLGYGSSADDDPGRVRPGAPTAGACFHSYLTYSATWDALSSDQKEAVKERLPFRRTGAPEPSISGYLYSDRTYSAGGRSLERASVRAF